MFGINFHGGNVPHPHQEGAGKIIGEGLIAAALGAIAFVVASVVDRADSKLAAIIRLGTVGAGLIWLFKRTCPFSFMEREPVNHYVVDHNPTPPGHQNIFRRYRGDWDQPRHAPGHTQQGNHLRPAPANRFPPVVQRNPEAVQSPRLAPGLVAAPQERRVWPVRRSIPQFNFLNPPPIQGGPIAPYLQAAQEQRTLWRVESQGTAGGFPQWGNERHSRSSFFPDVIVAQPGSTHSGNLQPLRSAPLNR